MTRFFVETLPPAGSTYTLTGENAAHAKVLRLRPGEAVTLCDGQGTDCPCTVEEGLTLRAATALPCPAEPKLRVALYLAFPKGDKAEHVIQKATELGAAELIFFPSRYCVSRPDPKSLPKKLERWQKIARSAAEQSGRGIIPPVRAVDGYDQALWEAARAALPVLFYENEAQFSLHQALADIGTPLASSPQEGPTPSPQGQGFAAAPTEANAGISDACPSMQIALMTGAEGGFSQEEILQARAAGLKICTLGPRILRCETAPLAGLTAVLYALGEL